MNNKESGKTNKVPLHRKWWFWAIIVLVVIAIGGGAASNQNGEKVGEIGTPESAQGTSSNSEYAVGDIIAIDGKEVAVAKVERNYSTGNSYATPKTGKEFVRMTLELKNSSDDTVPYYAIDWKMEDSEGSLDTYSITGSLSDDSALGSGELTSGGKKTGTLVFEVPAGDTNLRLHYQPSFWSNKEVIIKL